MCTTLFLLSTLAVLWRRRFGNRVQPEPSDGAVAGSSVDTDPQSPGRGFSWGPPSGLHLRSPQQRPRASRTRALSDEWRREQDRDT
ncbi:photoreceptor disk component PRCD isoform X2 [Artibeus jamaicensis]|uniref:photoreceptor disk component PRCD isoform X2 n=1 Tax=Artibeus jamaicensis TaxID=9417 RepID=UPI00235A6A40|nr:photoreceptor disk component PRCD isoform X2 [Artibeus jamaicensis]